MGRWQTLVTKDLGFNCGLLGATDGSACRDQLNRAPAAASAASTVSKHLNDWDHWRSYAGDPSLANLTPVERVKFMTDCLVAFGNGGRRNNCTAKVSCNGLLSALTYIAVNAECHNLVATLESSLVGSFRKDPEAVSARRESLPLPLAVVAAFERQISASLTPRWETIVLGSALIMLWGGLRWADLQRTSPNSLVLDNHILRGVCWRSKVTRSGQPFGLWTFGLTARPPERGWGIVWFLALAEWVQKLRLQAGSNIEIDYLLPAICEGKALATPMPYFQSLRMLRWCLVQPWLTEAVGPVDYPETYTLH